MLLGSKVNALRLRKQCFCKNIIILYFLCSNSLLRFFPFLYHLFFHKKVVGSGYLRRKCVSLHQIPFNSRDINPLTQAKQTEGLYGQQEYDRREEREGGVPAVSELCNGRERPEVSGIYRNQQSHCRRLAWCAGEGERRLDCRRLVHHRHRAGRDDGARDRSRREARPGQAARDDGERGDGVHALRGRCTAELPPAPAGLRRMAGRGCAAGDARRLRHAECSAAVAGEDERRRDS